jgi:hypothetical protein
LAQLAELKTYCVSRLAFERNLLSYI